MQVDLINQDDHRFSQDIMSTDEILHKTWLCQRTKYCTRLTINGHWDRMSLTASLSWVEFICGWLLLKCFYGYASLSWDTSMKHMMM